MGSYVSQYIFVYQLLRCWCRFWYLITELSIFFLRISCYFKNFIRIKMEGNPRPRSNTSSAWNYFIRYKHRIQGRGGGIWTNAPPPPFHPWIFEVPAPPPFKNSYEMSSPVSLKNDDYKKGNYALPKIVFKFLVLNKSIEHFDSWLLDTFKFLAYSFGVNKRKLKFYLYY